MPGAAADIVGGEDKARYHPFAEVVAYLLPGRAQVSRAEYAQAGRAGIIELGPCLVEDGAGLVIVFGVYGVYEKGSDIVSGLRLAGGHRGIKLPVVALRGQEPEALVVRHVEAAILAGPPTPDTNCILTVAWNWPSGAFCGVTSCQVAPPSVLRFRWPDPPSLADATYIDSPSGLDVIAYVSLFSTFEPASSLDHVAPELVLFITLLHVVAYTTEALEAWSDVISMFMVGQVAPPSVEQ